jgi:hypothetical protein
VTKIDQGEMLHFAKTVENTARASSIDAGPNNRSAKLRAMRDRRSAQRTLTIYRLVHVEHERDQGLGRCRNISDTGMKLDVHMAVAVGERVKVTFSPSLAVSGRIAWCELNECGVMFDERVDCAALLQQSSLEMHSDGAREPRLQATAKAKVIVDGQLLATVLDDISLHGMKVAHVPNLRPGLRVWVILECGAERAAVVRWVRGGHAGLFLSDPFSVEELGSVCALSAGTRPQ